MAFKFKGSIDSVNSILKGGIIFENEKLQNSQQIPSGKYTINQLDDSVPTDGASNTLVTNFGMPDSSAGMLSFNTGDWENTSNAPVRLKMRVINNGNDSDWVTIFDSGKTTVTWSSIATAGQTVITVPSLDYKKAIIFINGILQIPGYSYTTYAGSIRFTSPLNDGDQIYSIVGEDIEDTKIKEFSSIASTDQTVITLPEISTNSLVYINGVYQYPSTYTLSGTTITLQNKLYANDNIYVISNDKVLSGEEYTSTENQTDFTLSTIPDEPFVYVNGILQYQNTYTIIGNTLTFIDGLYENDLIFISDDPRFIDSVHSTYENTVENSQSTINIPFFHFSELQLFINGILQNPDNGAYTLNGTEITLSSGLQVGDDIHVIIYNAPIKQSDYATKLDLSSYLTLDEFNLLKTSLSSEGITLKWQAHLPTVEVAYGLPRRSLKIWQSGNTSVDGDYWLYMDGTVWTGIGTLGASPDSPFYKIDSNKDVITWSYTASTDNINIIYIPYNFGNINLFINGILQNIELGHYTYSGQYVTFSQPINTGDNVIAILGKLILSYNPYATTSMLSFYALKTDLSNFITSDALINYITKTDLSQPNAYEMIGKAGSISELRTIEPTINNQRILVKSYYVNQNIGGGEFYYDQFDLTSTDNGGTTIVTSSGKRWKRILTNNLYIPEEFGAIGDGVIDDYIPIQNMLNAGPEGCTFWFDGTKTYYNAFANDNTYKAVLLRNMWIRSLGAHFKFNGCALKRRKPEWNFNNLKNNYNTGSYYTDDHTALLWIQGGSNYTFDNGEIDCSVPITNMVDVNGNQTSQINYAVGTCMEFGIYATNANNMTFTNMYVHNSVFPYYLEDCTNIVGDNLRIEYTAQASARVDGLDLMLGGGFKTLRCINVDLKGVRGYRNANCTVEIEPNSDNVYVQGFSKYDFANSLVIVFSRNVEFDWSAFNVVQGSGLTIRGGATYETYNIRGKIHTNTASWMGVNIFNATSATTDMTGIKIDATTYNCKKHGVGVYNNSTTSTILIHADVNLSIWDDQTAESGVRYHGNVGGRVSGSAHNFALAAHKTGTSTDAMSVVFDMDVRDRNVNGLAIGTGSVAECARVDYSDRTAITTSRELRIVPVTTAGLSNTAGAVRIYGGTFDMRTTTLLASNLQATVPTTTGTAYVVQDTAGQPTYTWKLYRP